jgi:hypothetical protein
LTTDVYMLLLREMLRPDFKHCITFSSSLWKYPTLLWVYFERAFFGLSFLSKPKPDPVIFFNFYSRLFFALPKRVLKMSPMGCSDCLFCILFKIWELVFKVSFQWP